VSRTRRTRLRGVRSIGLAFPLSIVAIVSAIACETLFSRAAKKLTSASFFTGREKRESYLDSRDLTPLPPFP
jgi:hypothetical protein